MKQYRSIACVWDSELGCDIHMPESCTVHEAETAPQPIGLLDANGTPIYRVPPTVKLGFHT